MLVRRDGPSLVVHTPAKLNLFLEVLGRRPDGYHDLETVMVSIGLYDTLLFTEGDSQQTRLRCQRVGPHPAESVPLPEDADNLVVRAANLLRKSAGCDRGARIDLWKRIPIQSGLGGGSSDAAATLVGLNQLWRLELSSGELHRLAAQLGSDVNFFLDSPLAAACRSRGEQTAPLRLRQRLHFVVACPQAGLSTRDVFRRWQPEGPQTHSLAAVCEMLASGRVRREPQILHNALQAPARELNSEIDRTLAALRAAGASTALMSGSGTACFALCRSRPHARALAGRLRQRFASVHAVDTRV